MSERLVQQARSGDPNAFVALIEERQMAMTRVATAILGNPTDAADALQETLLLLWRELPRLRAPEAFPAWADRILVNACRLVLKRRARMRLREIDIAQYAAGGTSSSRVGPSSTAADAGLAERDAFNRAFESLDLDARALLVLHHLEGRPITDLATAFGVPTGTVKSRLHSARQRLDSALVREGANGPTGSQLAFKRSKR